MRGSPLACSLALLLALSLPSLSASAQPQSVRRHRPHHHHWHPPLPPPALLVRQNDRSRPLKLSTVAIETRIVGHLAETSLTMSFYNPNASVMEGDLYFPLPQGAAVSGYALDVGGQLVDGVVVEKHQARQIFEAEVRKGVDPGLVEWTKGNNFKTRVFPIPARGSRTIRVRYISELEEAEEGALYYLPLSFRDKVDKLSLRIEVVKAVAKPVVRRGGPQGLGFGAWQDSYVAKVDLRQHKLTQDLYVEIPQLKKRPVRVERAPDGKVYFSVRDHVRATAAPKVTTPRRIGLYWDASFSRAKANHKEELALLDQYLRTLGQNAVDVYLVVFRNEAERPRRFSLPAQRSALLATLRGLPYDGATQLASAQPPRGMPRVDLNLLFSDGISNFGAEEPGKLRAPVYAINVAATASHDFLRYLALRTGGAYFNLRKTNPEKVLPSIGAPVFSFISAKVDGATVTGLHPRYRMPVNGSFDLAGQLTAAQAALTLEYGYGTRVTQRHTFTIERSAAAKGDLLRRYWAQKNVTDLLIFPERNAEAIVRLGKSYSIVTPGTSLLVLESLAQYVQYGVRPPSTRPKLRKAYDEQLAQKAQQKKREDRSKLEHVLSLWNARLAWWNKTYRYPKDYRYQNARPKKSVRRRGMPRPSMERSADAPSPRAALGAAAPPPMAKASKQKNGSAAAALQPTIAMKPWDPKTPYIAALKAAPAAQRYAVYLQQRDKHGSAPAFYLDCAHYFRKQQQNRLALRILSNLAELELENPALLRVLAHRLTQVGELDFAAQLFQEVRKLRPEEPQSYRDLALVLERRADRQRRHRGGNKALADYRRALSLLARVVMQRWARFDEIEVIALTELNTILPKARALGLRGDPVDQRLIKKLTMDVRIVMTWDADSTDMDLHVVEPSGEEAYYGHNRTRIGGMVSRDFTRGYGPEVYAIRRAMRGKYKVRTKFYGSSAAKLAGAVTLQIDVYTNYGRPNQKRRSMTLRLTERKETFTVGTITF